MNTWCHALPNQIFHLNVFTQPTLQGHNNPSKLRNHSIQLRAIQAMHTMYLTHTTKNTGEVRHSPFGKYSQIIRNFCMKTSLRNWGLPNHFPPFADAKNVNVRFIHFKTLQITIQILSFYSLNCSSTWHQCYRHSLEVAVVWLFPFQNTSNTRAPPSIFVWVRTKQKHSWVSENHQFLPRCTDKHYWSAVSNVRIETKNHSSTLISLFNWYNLFWLDHFSVWLKSAMYYVSMMTEICLGNSYSQFTCLQF